MNKGQNRFWKGAGNVSAEMLGLLTVFSGVMAGVIFTLRPGMRKYKKKDLQIFEAVKAQTTPAHTRLMSFITFFGTHRFFIPANLSLIFYFLYVRKQSWLSIRVASIAITSLLLMFLLKGLFKRKRPVSPLLHPARGLSFPSGHAIMGVTFYGLLIYIISATIKEGKVKVPLIIFLLVFIQLIGFSRVYLRLHYASDVVIGYLIGTMWLLTSLEALKRLESYNKNRYTIYRRYSEDIPKILRRYTEDIPK